MHFADYSPIHKTKRMSYDPTLLMTIRDFTLLWQWRHNRTALESLKTVNRKVQGVPQSQIAANPRLQEEEKKDKNEHVQNKQTNAREKGLRIEWRFQHRSPA